MDINKMRNIVILKNLPSNIVEEAFVILKKNQKIKKLEYVDSKSDNFSENIERNDEDEYVVKEAELLISNYINELENQDLSGKKASSDLARKYKNLKRFAIFLGCVVSISFLYIVSL